MMALFGNLLATDNKAVPGHQHILTPLIGMPPNNATWSSDQINAPD